MSRSDRLESWFNPPPDATSQRPAPKKSVCFVFSGVREQEKLRSDCRGTAKATRTTTVGLEQPEICCRFVQFSTNAMDRQPGGPQERDRFNLAGTRAAESC